MTDKPWIAIDPSHFRRPVEERIGGATVVSSTSPYSVPQAMTTYDDKSSSSWVLELKYIGPDEPMETITTENWQVMRGRNSGRLLKVLVGHAPNAMVDRDQIVHDLKRAIGAAEQEARLPAAVENFRIISAAIDENKNRFLVEVLEAASK